MSQLFARKRAGDGRETLCKLTEVKNILDRWVKKYREKGYRSLPIKVIRRRKKKSKPSLKKPNFETNDEDKDDFPEIIEEESEDVKNSEQLHKDPGKFEHLTKDAKDSQEQRQSDQGIEVTENPQFKEIEGESLSENSDKQNEDMHSKTRPLSKDARNSGAEIPNEDDEKRSDIHPTNPLVKEFLDLTDTAGGLEDHKTFLNPPMKTDPFYVDSKTPVGSFMTQIMSGDDIEKPLGEDKQTAESSMVEQDHDQDMKYGTSSTMKTLKKKTTEKTSMDNSIDMNSREHVGSSSETLVHDGKEGNVVSQIKHGSPADLNRESDKFITSQTSNPLDNKRTKPLGINTEDTVGSTMLEPVNNNSKETPGSSSANPLEKDFNKEREGMEQDDFPEYPTPGAHAVSNKTPQMFHKTKTKINPRRFFRFVRRRRRRRRLSIFVWRRRRLFRRRRSSSSRPTNQRMPTRKPRVQSEERENVMKFLKTFRCHVSIQVAEMVLSEGCMDKIQLCVRKYNRVAFSKFADQHKKDENKEGLKDDVLVKTEL